MLITIEKNNYVESTSERENVVQAIVDAFIAKMNFIERNYESAIAYGLEYRDNDNGLYVCKAKDGRYFITTNDKLSTAIRVSAREMQIAFDCLHRAGYYYYESYWVINGIKRKQCWWWKKPSFLNLTPSKCPTFNWFIG